MSINDKRIAICGIDFLPIDQATVEDRPGSDTIKVRGEFRNVPIQSGELRETEEPGMAVEQELEAVVTDTGAANLSVLREMFRHYGLVRLRLTNGEVRVVGTAEFPVLVSMELSGVPGSLTLTVERESPEPAKLFASL